jgi:hypothetical protein
MLSVRFAFLVSMLSPALAACAAGTGGPPAAAAEGSGSIVRAGCRQGECSWLRIVRIEDVEAVPEGRLRRIVARHGTSLYPSGAVPGHPPRSTRWAAADRSDYVFCSTVRPAYAFPDETGGLIVHFLDLHDPAGYQLGSARLYMRFCHGLDAVPVPETLRSLGYAPGTRSEQIEGARPEAMTRF